MAHERTTDLIPDEQNLLLLVLTEIDRMAEDPSDHLAVIIDRRLANVIRAVKLSGKKGNVVIKIDVSPDGEHRVRLAGNVTAKLPERPTNTVTLYADDAGGLHREMQQLPLPGKPVLVTK